MKNNKIFLGVVFVVILFLTAAKSSPSSYRSEWVTVPAGQLVSFSHPLNKEPDSLTVWTKLNPTFSDVGNNIRPWTELSGLILVNRVSGQFVEIQNVDETDWQISIFVR